MNQELRTRILRHVVDTDGSLPSECYNRVLLGSQVAESFFHDYDPKTNAFSDNSHSLIFDFSQGYFAQYGRPPSDDVIMQEISRNTSLDAFAKRDLNEVLIQIRQYDAHPAETPMLIDHLTEQYQKDRQTYIMQKAVKIREDSGIEESLRYTLEQIARIGNKNVTGTTRGVLTGTQFADDVIEGMKNAEDLVTPVAKYGFRRWDRFTGGLYAGTVTVFGAGLSVGKSWVLHEIGLVNALDLGKNVVFWNLEMLEEQIAQRIVCRQTGITINRLRRGFANLTAEEQESFEHAQQGIRELGDRVLFLDRSRCTNLAQVKSEMIQHFGARKVDLLVCDYLDKVQPSRGRYGADHERISMVSNEMKGFSLENGLATATATQNNRRGNKNPDADINELSFIQVAKDADTVVTLTEDPDNIYEAPDPDDDLPGTPGILNARFVRGRSHGKQSGEPFRLSVEFSTGRIAEASDFRRSAVGSAFGPGTPAP